MKNGKLPLTSKIKPGKQLLTSDAVFGTPSAIPDDVREEMDKKGWVPRWLNAKQVASHQGHHPKGWKIYKREKVTPGELKFGSDPDGVIRRGDNILGYKPKDVHGMHKRFLQQQAELHRLTPEIQAQELKEHAKSIGLDTTIETGFGDDDDEE